MTRKENEEAGSNEVAAGQSGFSYCSKPCMYNIFLFSPEDIYVYNRKYKIKIYATSVFTPADSNYSF